MMANGSTDWPPSGPGSNHNNANNTNNTSNSESSNEGNQGSGGGGFYEGKPLPQQMPPHHPQNHHPHVPHQGPTYSHAGGPFHPPPPGGHHPHPQQHLQPQPQHYNRHPLQMGGAHNMSNRFGNPYGAPHPHGPGGNGGMYAAPPGPPPHTLGYPPGRYSHPMPIAHGMSPAPGHLAEGPPPHPGKHEGKPTTWMPPSMAGDGSNTQNPSPGHVSSQQPQHPVPNHEPHLVVGSPKDECSSSSGESPGTSHPPSSSSSSSSSSKDIKDIKDTKEPKDIQEIKDKKANKVSSSSSSSSSSPSPSPIRSPTQGTEASSSSSKNSSSSGPGETPPTSRSHPKPPSSLSPSPSASAPVSAPASAPVSASPSPSPSPSVSAPCVSAPVSASVSAPAPMSEAHKPTQTASSRLQHSSSSSAPPPPTMEGPTQPNSPYPGQPQGQPPHMAPPGNPGNPNTPPYHQHPHQHPNKQQAPQPPGVGPGYHPPNYPYPPRAGHYGPPFAYRPNAPYAPYGAPYPPGPGGGPWNPPPSSKQTPPPPGNTHSPSRPPPGHYPSRSPHPPMKPYPSSSGPPPPGGSYNGPPGYNGPPVSSSSSSAGGPAAPPPGSSPNYPGNYMSHPGPYPGMGPPPNSSNNNGGGPPLNNGPPPSGPNSAHPQNPASAAQALRNEDKSTSSAGNNVSSGNSSQAPPVTSPVAASAGSDGIPVHDDTSQQSTLSQSSDRSDGGRQTPKGPHNFMNVAGGGFPPPPGSPRSGAPSPSGGPPNMTHEPGGGGGSYPRDMVSPGWQRTAASPVSVPSSRGSDSLTRLFELDDDPGRRPWLERLLAFMEDKGTPITQCPTISKNPLDLYKLYIFTRDRGGFIECNRNKSWKDIASQLGIAASSSGAYTLKKHYGKNLLPFECYFDRGGVDPGPILAQMEASGKKKGKNASTPSQPPPPVPSPGSQDSRDSYSGTNSQDGGYPGQQQQYPGNGPSGYGGGYPPNVSGDRPPSHPGLGPGGYPSQGPPPSGYGGYPPPRHSGPPEGGYPHSAGGGYPPPPSGYPPPPRPGWPGGSYMGGGPNGTAPPPPTASAGTPPSSSSASINNVVSSSSASASSVTPPAGWAPNPAYVTPPRGGPPPNPNPPTSGPGGYLPPSTPDHYSQQQSYPGSGPQPGHFGGIKSSNPPQPSTGSPTPPGSGGGNPSGSRGASTPGGYPPGYVGQRPPMYPGGQPPPGWQNRYPGPPYNPSSGGDRSSWSNPNGGGSGGPPPRPWGSERPPMPSGGGYVYSNQPNNGPPWNNSMMRAGMRAPYRPEMRPSGPGNYPQSNLRHGFPGGRGRELLFPPGCVEATQPLLIKRRKYNKTDIQPIDGWRLVMTLKSGLLMESTWALDALNILLYDDNAFTYFGLSNMPGLLEALLEHWRSSLLSMFDITDDLELEDPTRRQQVRKRGHRVSIDYLSSEHQRRRKLCDDEEGEAGLVKNEVVSGDIEMGKVKDIDVDDKVQILTGFNYTKKPRFGFEESNGGGGEWSMEREDDALFVTDEDRSWDLSEKSSSDVNGTQHWSQGGGNTTKHIITHYASGDLNLIPFVRVLKDLSSSSSSSLLNSSLKKKKKEPPLVKPKVESTSSSLNGESQSNKNRSSSSSSDAEEDFPSEESKEDIIDRIKRVSGIVFRDPESARSRWTSPNLEDENYMRDEPSLSLTSESQDSLGKRSLCISTILRNLSFLPGNEYELSKSATFLTISGRLLLLYHWHPPRTLKQRNYDRGEEDDSGESCTSLIGDGEWWWDYLHVIRENVMVSLANIAGALELKHFDEALVRPLLDGLLEWAVSSSAYAQDPFPNVGHHSPISPQRLAIEALCKLSLQESNVDFILSTPPYSRIQKLCRLLAKKLYRYEDQVLREFSINLLYYLSGANSGVARTIATADTTIGLLLGFIEQAEQNALVVAQQHGVNALRDNPDSMGTSLDMLRRAASTLSNLSQHPDNIPLFLRQEQRLLSLVMSQILDQGVEAILSNVLFNIGRAASSPPPPAPSLSLSRNATTKQQTMTSSSLTTNRDSAEENKK